MKKAKGVFVIVMVLVVLVKEAQGNFFPIIPKNQDDHYNHFFSPSNNPFFNGKFIAPKVKSFGILTLPSKNNLSCGPCKVRGRDGKCRDDIFCTK